jgi:hypothetical protein
MGKGSKKVITEEETTVGGYGSNQEELLVQKKSVLDGYRSDFTNEVKFYGLTRSKQEQDLLSKIEFPNFNALSLVKPFMKLMNNLHRKVQKETKVRGYNQIKAEQYINNETDRAMDLLYAFMEEIINRYLDNQINLDETEVMEKDLRDMKVLL